MSQYIRLKIMKVLLTFYLFLEAYEREMGICSARSRNGQKTSQLRNGAKAQAYEAQQQQAQQQIEAQQRQIEALQRQKQQQPQSHQKDLTHKLIKYAELKKQGILTEEEFQKLKMDLLSRMQGKSTLLYYACNMYQHFLAGFLPLLRRRNAENLFDLSKTPTGFLSTAMVYILFKNRFVIDRWIKK